jgi:hypothetical protein
MFRSNGPSPGFPNVAVDIKPGKVDRAGAYLGSNVFSFCSVSKKKIMLEPARIFLLLKLKKWHSTTSTEFSKPNAELEITTCSDREDQYIEAFLQLFLPQLYYFNALFKRMKTVSWAHLTSMHAVSAETKDSHPWKNHKRVFVQSKEERRDAQTRVMIQMHNPA